MHQELFLEEDHVTYIHKFGFYLLLLKRRIIYNFMYPYFSLLL